MAERNYTLDQKDRSEKKHKSSPTKISQILRHLCTYSEVSLLNKSSRLAAALGVTKFMTVIAMNSVTLCCAT
jgi:hypothetical protein